MVSSPQALALSALADLDFRIDAAIPMGDLITLVEERLGRNLDRIEEESLRQLLARGEGESSSCSGLPAGWISRPFPPR